MAEAADRHRGLPAFALDHARASPPSVYFLTPDHPTPVGGIRVIYRHVDILNACGIEASVLHRKPGFSCNWFEHKTRVADVASILIGRNDLLVVPEVDIRVLENVPSGIRRVIFNQNSHLTWKQGADQVAQFYAAGPDLAAILCVSEHNEKMLRGAFPTSPVRRLHLGIDPAIFNPGKGPRPRRIAYMPRRGQDDARQVLAMLRGRGLLEGWEVLALDGLPHEEIAARLKTARIFLAFTRQEGFGLPAAEAMACGCYVVGNDGYGGREFFLRAFCTPIDTGDIDGFAREVEAVLDAEDGDPDWCGERGRRASRFVLQEYSLQRERDDVAAIYTELLASDKANREAFR